MPKFNKYLNKIKIYRNAIPKNWFGPSKYGNVVEGTVIIPSKVYFYI